MKRLTTIFVCLCLLSAAASGQKKYTYTEASDLNLIGKILPDTPNPYHRVDTVKYKGFTKSENNQVRSSAGLAVLFKTDSPSIVVKTTFGSFVYEAVNTMPIAYRGYDLYIRDGKDWVWAGAGAATRTKPDADVTIVSGMDGSEHECLLYLPIYTELYSVKIGVEQGHAIEAIESPFRHRIAIFGSSYTHGISTSRAGMSYPMQFMRHTGLQMLSLGCSGNCKMQPYFAAVLEDVDADAFIFDAFSNPDAKMIEERLIPFIDRMIAAHPGKPMIFQQTIYRERRNFNNDVEKTESAKQEMADSLFRNVIRKDPKYKDVYFIQTNASLSHETSVDGIHPDDYGYYLWSRSIEKPILKILRKYGIR